MNVLSVLREVAAREPDRPALIAPDGRQITFAGLRDRIDRAAAGLQRLGLQPGERVIVMIPMSIDLYVALLAVLQIGTVAVFVDPWIGARQIAAFAAFAEPRAWIGVPRSHLLRLFSGALRSIPLTVTTGFRVGPLPAHRTLAELEEGPGDGSIHPAESDSPALITFTSGSSGEPKGANRTHGFLLAQHRALAAEFPAAGEDVDMTMFPVFSLNNLAVGVTTVVPDLDFRRVDQVDAARVLRQMAGQSVTTCTASPPFFDRLTSRIEASPGERPRLRRLLTGGAPVSDAQLRAWRHALPETEILVAYGSTEAEPVAHLSAEERLEVARSTGNSVGYCVGRPVDRVRARLLRIQDGPVELGEEGWAAWDVPAGEIGELAVSGEHVCRDYYRNPRAVLENKVREPDGTVWHRMGDTGSFDREGRFWIAGRVHSTIWRQGRPVHPQLIEQAAYGEDPRIRRVAAVGLPDPELGQRVAVVVETDLVIKTDAGEELREDVLARLAVMSQPVDEIILIGEPLPVDPRHNSKIDYRALRDRLIQP